MKLGRRKFRAAWWSVALTTAGVMLFIVLGMWQLERADYKESVQSKFEQRLSEPYQEYSPEIDLDDIEFRKLIVSGRYDNAHNFLIDNQIHRGKAGYHVLTPLQLTDSDSIILVNRGWAEWGVSRDSLPQIPAAASDSGVTGIANFPTEPAMRLGGTELSEQWPQLVRYVDIEALQEQFSDQLLPVVLWLAPEQAGNYVRDWNPVWMRPEKSRAYATQWFAFAVLALVFFAILNLRKIE
jgi:surfeit locus 1 family protein